MGLALRGPVDRTLGETHVAPTRAGQIRVAESVRESPQNATNAANKVATLHSVFKSIRSITGPGTLGGEVGRKSHGGLLCSVIALLAWLWKALVVPMWALVGRELPSVGWDIRRCVSSELFRCGLWRWCRAAERRGAGRTNPRSDGGTPAPGAAPGRHARRCGDPGADGGAGSNITTQNPTVRRARPVRPRTCRHRGVAGFAAAHARLRVQGARTTGVTGVSTCVGRSGSRRLSPERGA
jgi:hypothetical protein